MNNVVLLEPEDELKRLQRAQEYVRKALDKL